MPELWYLPSFNEPVVVNSMMRCAVFYDAIWKGLSRKLVRRGIEQSSERLLWFLELLKSAGSGGGKAGAWFSSGSSERVGLAAKEGPTYMSRD
jgi:hypothetical protein